MIGRHLAGFNPHRNARATRDEARGHPSQGLR